jgi:hypothetical protein
LIATSSLETVWSNYRIQIWNIETGVIAKEISECFVGLCSFGFLTRPYHEQIPFILHAYDMDAKFIGAVFTDKISPDRIEKVAHSGDNCYSFQFENFIGFELFKFNFCFLKFLLSF